MRIFYAYCPHCDALKAVAVDLHTEWQGDPIMGAPVTFGDVDRVPEEDECACHLTPEEAQDVIDIAVDKALFAGPSFIEPG